MYLFFFIFVIFLNKISANSNYSPDYPNVTYCILPETMVIYKNSSLSYNYLKRQLGLDRRCTHIQGSLHIVEIERFANGSEPDLSFLDSIEEISGILVIREVSVRRIDLSNLRIIRGITSNTERFSLQISHNIKNGRVYLEEVDLRNLRVIMDKDVRINQNHGLGYLLHKIDWNQILLNPPSQKVMLRTTPVNKQGQDYRCHGSCEPWSSAHGNLTQYCFGPGEQDCQQRTKCVRSRGYTWCQFNGNVETPCDRECAGGCQGNQPLDCVACRRVFKKDQCVSHCASENDIHFGKVKGVKDQMTFTTGALCTSQCPESLLDQDDLCIYQCNFTTHYKTGNKCQKCPNRECYVKIGDQFMCDLKDIARPYLEPKKHITLTKRILQKLTDCTILIGHLRIDDASFKNGVTIPLLFEHLRNIEEIIGSLTVHLKKTTMKNLTFLSNLKEIRGTALDSVIMYGLGVWVYSIEYYGLKKLTKVYGSINLKHRPNLCYDNTIPWEEITADEYSVPTQCNRTCHSLCTRGCWGPDNTFCYDCQYKYAGDHCVKNCDDAIGYFTLPSMKCQKCHSLCGDNCTGPTIRDCIKCRFAKENGACVAVCSSDHYPMNSSVDGQIECRKCHATCFVGEMLKDRNITSACTGPSNHVGVGGCTMCVKVIRRDNATNCHSGKCPEGFFETILNETLNVLSVRQTSCDPCHLLCGHCSDKGNHRSFCGLCKGFWFKDYCIDTCPKLVQNVSRELNIGDHCPVCHSECSGGCQLENDMQTCTGCKHKKLYLDKKRFTCVPNCPAERNYTDYINGDMICLAYEDTIQYQQRKRILFVAIGSLSCLVTMVTVIVIFFRWKTRQSKIKAELKAFYSNFNEPNMKNLQDHTNRPPNKNRLQMICIKDLIFDIKSKPLGAGAFGKVYRGYWKVRGPDDNIYRLDVVIKIINNSSKASTNEFLEEAQIMASVSHRYCLPLIGVCLSFKKPCLVSSFAEYGSLEKYLHQFSSKLTSYILLKWSEQIADGMSYLNMIGIIHRDLAARNILVTSKNIVQITDFGLAKLVEDTDDGIVVQSGRVPIRWLALETLISANYSSASDVWAYGITLWEIFTFGKRPYVELETHKVKTFLQEGNRLSQPEICTLDVYMVMIKCWLEDPKMRPSFTELTAKFDQFSQNSNRYLFMQKENNIEYTLPDDGYKDNICLNPVSMSMTSQHKKSQTLSNGSSDETNFLHVPYHDNSMCNSVNPSYYRDDNDDETVLPMRKKRKRNVSFDRLRTLPKVGLSKLLSTKSSDSQSLPYSPCNSLNNRKTPRVRYDSTSALIAHQISFDCEGSPINPQIAKLLKQESWPSYRSSPCSIKQDRPHHSERILPNNKFAHSNGTIESLKLGEPNPGSRSPSLSSADASQQPLIVNRTNENETKMDENSPDSGNSHVFDIDDYLEPNRVQSLGYYNLTPSPTDLVKPPMDLSDDNIMVQNATYSQIVDDDYLEPITKSSN